MIKNPCIIIIDRPTEAVREDVHNVIKRESSGWWHHYADIWIAGGHRPSEWRDLLTQVAPGVVLVLALPENASERGWAFSWRERVDSSDSLGGPAAWLTYLYSGRDLEGTEIRQHSTVQEQARDDDGYSDEPPF
jgi:hypothetical protein